MLSKKLTLSLTFLVMVLAIGLVVTPTFGHDPDAGGTFAATFTPGELMDDVSTVDHADITDIQVPNRVVTVTSEYADGCSQWSNWGLGIMIDGSESWDWSG